MSFLYRGYEAVGPEADELRQLVAEALDEHLNPEIEVVPGWSEIDEDWFAAGAVIEQLLARQNLIDETPEIDPAELDALSASERSRGERD